VSWNLDWDLDLDDEGTPPGAPGGPPRAPRRFVVLAGLAVVLGLLALIVPDLLRGQEPRPAPRTLGGRLPVPLAITTPDGAGVIADDRYVGLQVPGAGALLITVPREVSAGAGARRPLPGDPASWLRGQQDVYVSRVRQVEVAGRWTQQVDYRRSALARPGGRFARLALFCSDSCSQITRDARVRSTFLPVGGRTVLVEAVWRTDDAAPRAPMPPKLRTAYDALLAGITQPGQAASRG
jgi:hypothetical protein